MGVEEFKLEKKALKEGWKEAICENHIHEKEEPREALFNSKRKAKKTSI